MKLITLHFYAPLGGAYCRLCVRPSDFISPNPVIDDVVDKKCSRPLDKGLWTEVFKGHTRNLKVTENIYKKNTILTFLNITIKDTDIRSSETYSELHFEYMQYIRYGPWGQTTLRNGNC
jgi:hypothetical protein